MCLFQLVGLIIFYSLIKKKGLKIEKLTQDK